MVRSFNVFTLNNYEVILLHSYQSGHFFATAKSHKFDFSEDMSLDSLKLLLIIDQMGTYICNASKVDTKYLSPLCKNEFSITDTLSFPELLRNSSNEEIYEDVS